LSCSASGAPETRGEFTCNVCGTRNPAPAGGFGRENIDCAGCSSTVRLRSVVYLLSMEIFGLPLTLPEFPVLRSVRMLGMSDWEPLAARLAEKFDYTNTFYHQEPRFDIVTMDERDLGRYDVIVTSEVLEHVPPPPQRAFATLYRMLKPDGLLALTVPYTVQPATREHFPQLADFGLVELGGRTVLVNRRPDGAIETFDNLVFHGGDGSTVEMRQFCEADLRRLLSETGFTAAIRGENCPEHGVVHRETWSLPIAARKGAFRPALAEIAAQHRDRAREVIQLRAELARLTAELETARAQARELHERTQAEIAATTAWTRKIEAEFAERTQWAIQLQGEVREQLANTRHFQQEAEKNAARAATLESELRAVRSALWSRLGRALRLIP
jgi:SAM-dependent methyltransferase